MSIATFNKPLYKPIKLKHIKLQKNPSIVKPISWKNPSFNVKPIRWIHEKHDTDRDGVPNFMDCNPWNPNEQGKIHEAAKKAGKIVKEKAEKAVKKVKEITEIKEGKPTIEGKYIHREAEPSTYEVPKLLHLFVKVRGLWRKVGKFPKNEIQEAMDATRVAFFNDNQEVEDFYVTEYEDEFKLLQKAAMKDKKALETFQTRLKRKTQWEHSKEAAKEQYKEHVLGPKIVRQNVLMGTGLVESRPYRWRELASEGLVPRKKTPGQYYFSASGTRITKLPSSIALPQTQSVIQRRQVLVPRSSDNIEPRRGVKGLPPPSYGWFGSLAGSEPYRVVPYLPVGAPRKVQPPAEEEISEESGSEYIKEGEMQ